MSDSLGGAIIIAGTALSIIFVPMLWEAYCNKREERKKKRERQHKWRQNKCMRMVKVESNEGVAYVNPRYVVGIYCSRGFFNEPHCVYVTTTCRTWLLEQRYSSEEAAKYKVSELAAAFEAASIQEDFE